MRSQWREGAKGWAPQAIHVAVNKKTQSGFAAKPLLPCTYASIRPKSPRLRVSASPRLRVSA